MATSRDTTPDPEVQRETLRLWVARGKVIGGLVGFLVATTVARRAGLDWVDAGLRGLIGAAALVFGEQGNGAVLRVVLWGLAILTNLTVLQRIGWVYLNTRPEGIAVGNAVWKMPDWLQRKLNKKDS